MAFLIYLLQNEFEVIEYSLNSKVDSRKHFAQSLNPQIIAMQGINKYFEFNEYKLNVREYKKRIDYDTYYKEFKTLLK